jgi:hypothetical protein
MRSIVFFTLFYSASAFAQADSTQWLRGFPITDYMVKLNDSTIVVQLEMPEDLKLKEKQLGLLFGTYQTSLSDAVQKGYGRCHLIKGVYYYFAIGHNTSSLAYKQGDLIYTFMPKTGIYYNRIAKLAGHFVRLQDVQSNPFYDRYDVFRHWMEKDEKTLIDSMAADIQFTGQHFLKTDPSMDRQITKGEYSGQKLLYVMAECQPSDIVKFLDYMIARPRAYAGKEWKITEIFATWLNEGAPSGD